MKRMLIAAALALAAGGQAFAADLPPPAPPPPPPRAPATYVPIVEPLFTWSGVYFGVNGGYGFGTSKFTIPTGGGVLGCATGCTASNSPDGFLAGGTLGANYQMGGFVIGIEGDLDWADLSGSTSCGTTSCETKSDFLGTARGRAGWAWDRILFYGTAGGAFGNIKAGTSADGGYNSSDKFGWTAGAGIEAAFATNWTARIEYLYVDLGSGTCTVACLNVPVSVSLTENVVRAGVDYKFSW